MSTMKTIVGSLLRALLLLAIAESAMASDELTLAIDGQSAERMLEHSRLTREIYYSNDPSREIALGNTFKRNPSTFEYRVYSYDTNWKCYSRTGIDQGEGFVDRVIIGRKPPRETFCIFKRGFNPRAATAPIPVPVEIELAENQQQAIIERADEVGESIVPVSTYIGTQKASFKTLRYSNWTCNQLKSGSSLPFGSRHPKSKCTYAPDVGSQIASGDSGVSTSEVSR